MALATRVSDSSRIFEMIYSGLETDLAHETLAMNGPDNKYRDGRRNILILDTGAANLTSSRGKLIPSSLVVPAVGN